MVEPGDALLAAEQYFREALRSQEGVSRGKALKALVQTVEARQSLFNVSPQPQEIIDCCREALDLLPPAQEPRKNLELLRTLDKYASLTVEEIERHLPSLQSLMRDWDCREQVGIVMEYAALFFGACPSKSLGVLTAARSLFEQHGSEAQRWSRWGMQLSLLGTTITLQKSIVATAIKNVERAASVVRAQAKDEGWNDHVLASALLKLSILSANNNQEAAGLALAEEATKLSSALGAEVGDAIEHLKSELTFGIGVNQYNAGDRSNAIRLYGISMGCHLHWNLPEHAMRDLHRIADLACSKKVGKAEQRRQIVHSGIAVLRANALRAELELGAQGTQIIQGMCQQLVAASSEVGLDLDAKLSLFQIAKGFRSAAAIKVKGKYDKNNDEEGSILRTKIIDAEMEIVKANQNTLPLSHRLDDFLLVSPCTYSDQPLPGISPHERLLNLQRTYDEHVYRRLFTGDVNPDVVMQDEVQLRSAVPEKTVLLDFYLGKMTDGRSACFVRQITREEIRSADISRTASLADNITIGHDDLRVRLSTFELLVQEVREAILQDPDGNPVSEKGGEDLRWDAKGYLAQFLDLADSLRSSGKNHVCIVPHGALHFYPFHLIHTSRGPLALEWKVSYLPNLQLLRRARHDSLSCRRDRALTSIGLSFQTENQFNLEPMPESINEAELLAEVFDAEPISEREATRAALIDALQRSRYVHLSTHGKHNVYAPSFQCLFLTPDQTSDGRFYAHELLSLDLAGLEVITLSACETALGRYDSADNLRGLPGALLLAGVSSVVGTLWPVNPACSEAFFPDFYKNLRDGASRMDAFSSAQSKTQGKFPQYRDWGAFYLMGDWS